VTDFERLVARREDILRIATRYGARNLRVFGSAARGDSSADSDVDLLVDWEPGRSLFDLSLLVCELHELLGRQVDVVSPDALFGPLRQRILREARPL
jgi:predicted nucleotidyltransferase